MRDFRDAKAMAQTLRDSLTTKAITISHGESLELVSKMLGAADWNTLSAMLQTNRSRARTQAPQNSDRDELATRLFRSETSFPFRPRPYPLFVGREKTMQAVNRAFEGQREIVLAIQRDSDADEPGFKDIYEIGVLAQLLQIERLARRHAEGHGGGTPARRDPPFRQGKRRVRGGSQRGQTRGRS